MKKYFLILAVLIAAVMITANNCDPVCGDGTCDSGEDQSSCFEDCGNKTTPQPTPYCGDGTCNSGESCSTCSSDCGSCPITKGNLSVQSTPSNASVYINNNFVGYTPYFNQSINAGTYNITLIKFGYSSAKMVVNVNAGQLTSIYPTLTINTTTNTTTNITLCGNGVINAGEECEISVANGACVNCAVICNSGYTENPTTHACVSGSNTTTYSCTGSGFANAVLCTGDSANLTMNTTRTLVSACGSPKCEYTCGTGYVKNATANICQLNTTTTYSCVGSGFANAVLCTGDSNNLTMNTNRTLVSACGSPKCEYTCGTGYVKSGSSCVLNSTACTDSDGGVNPSVYGNVSSGGTNYFDNCVSNVTLNEGYCTVSGINVTALNCGNISICQAGRCI